MKYSETEILAICNALESIATPEFKGLRDGVVTYGLCHEVNRLVNKNRSFYISPDWLEEFYDILKSWPSYSGNQTYPVPVPKDSVCGDEVEAYGTLNHYAGEYGALRKNLASYLAKEIRSKYLQ